MTTYRRFSAGRIASTFLAAFAASSVLACASPAEQTFTEVDAERSMIRVDHPDFSAARWQYGALRDPRSGGQTHLAEFDGSPSRAAILAMRTGPGYVVPTRGAKQCVDDMLSPVWKLAWGDTGRASSPQGPASYQLFQVCDGVLGCVAVSQTGARPRTTWAAREIWPAATSVGTAGR